MTQDTTGLMAFFHPIQPVQFSGKTIIIPIVSTANVSQLAVDLLIASLSLQKLGVFDPSYFIPVVGPTEDGTCGVITPLELYGSPNSQLLVLQQRSPVLKSLKQEFVDSLLALISAQGVSAVICLAGLEPTDRTDDQMLVPTYYVRPSSSGDLKSTPFSRLSDLPIPPFRSPVPPPPGESNNTQIPFLPGGGLTRRILSSLPEQWSTPIVALVQYALEGDNRADAQLLAAVTAKVMGIDQVSWKQPNSWSHGLFGAPPDQSLYG